MSKFALILTLVFASISTKAGMECIDLESCLQVLPKVERFAEDLPKNCKSDTSHSISFVQDTFFAHHSSKLESELEKILKASGLSDPVTKKKLSVALVKIHQDDSYEVASANGLEMQYAASLPKIAILYGAFHEIENGSLEFTDDLKGSLTKMIRFSSNTEATRVLNLIGKDRLLEILQSEPHKFYDKSKNGGLWVGKEYSKNSAYKRDPLHGTSHGANPLQVARLYTLLETGSLLSKENTSRMKEILSNPGINHKFVKGLNGIDGLNLYRKSGTWRTYHSDSVLVVDGDTRYVLVGLSNDENGGDWLEKLARKAHKELTSNHFIKN
jgi:beta-lactamase class A